MQHAFLLPRQSTPARSPSSAHRPPPLFIPDSPLRRLSKLTLEQVAELAARSTHDSDTDDEGDRWSIPIFLAGDASTADVQTTAACDDKTPRQLLYLPMAVSNVSGAAGRVNDDTIGLLSSPFFDSSTPRRPTGAGPRTPLAGHSPVVDRKVSAGSSGSDEATWSPPSPSELIFVLATEHGSLPDNAVSARRNRQARGPQDSIWRHCSPLRSSSDPDLPGESDGSSLFDPGYSLDAQASAGSVQRGPSPFDLSEDVNRSRLPHSSILPRCPSPLDSTFMAVLSCPPVNSERAGFTSQMAVNAAQKGELRLVVWMEDDEGRSFSGSLPFRRYTPPVADVSLTSNGRADRGNRFASNGCVEYAAYPRSSPSWAIQPESEGGPSELRLVKVTLSDDDRRNFVAPCTTPASNAPCVALDDFGSLELVEQDEQRPQWVLCYEIDVDSEHTTITLLSFKCDPDLLDRSQAVETGKPRTGGGAFRLRIGSAADAPSRLSLPQRRLNSIPSSPEAFNSLKLRPAASESRLMLLRSPSASPAPSAASSPLASSSPAHSTFSLFGRKRSLSSARTDPTSGPPVVAPRRSHSLRSAGSLLDGLTPGKLLARDAPSRSSAPLPFVPSSVTSGSGQDGASKVRSSPGQGLPPSLVAPPRQPSATAVSKRKPATGSPTKGARSGLGSAKHLRERHVTAGSWLL